MIDEDTCSPFLVVACRALTHALPPTGNDQYGLASMAGVLLAGSMTPLFGCGPGNLCLSIFRTHGKCVDDRIVVIAIEMVLGLVYRGTAET